jgi:protein-tyrosine sulfotransferase
MRYVTQFVLPIYHGLVRRRTTVRVAIARQAQLAAVPIFLTGVFRSGTTLLRYIIDSHSHICCPPETNFLRACADLLRDRDNRFGLASMGFDDAHVCARARSFAAYFFENYASSAGKPRWADKTPAYVGILDEIDRIFPTAQYVMIYRHGLDVAHSITRGGRHVTSYVERYLREASDPRPRAAAYWSAQTERMLAFEKAHPDRCHAVKYEEMCVSPERILRDVFSFLTEPWEPAVLEYWRCPHDVGAEDGRALAARGFNISEGNYRIWPQSLIDEAMQVAGDTLRKLGYSAAASTEGHASW